MLEDRNIEVKHLLKKQNESIRNLIINKTHLIEGSAMPDSFAAFFSSTMIFDLYAAAGAPDEVPQHLRDDPRSAFPLDFVEHITTVTESLKARIEDLHAQYTPRLRVPGHQPEGQTQGSSSADSDQSRHIQISN